jgi:hypothetical protein
MRIAPYVVGGASIAACLVAVNRAHAHPEFNPLSTNRYVKLDLVAPDELRMAYTILFGAQPALAARQGADANGDGRLDASEQRALGATVEKQVLAGLRVVIDGKESAPRFETPQVGLMGDEVGPSPFSVDLIARIQAAPAAEHSVTLDDRSEPPLLGESEIRVEESPATRLLAGEKRTVFRGPRRSSLEDRSLTFRFGAAPNARPVEKPRARWPYALGALALLGLAGVVLRYRNMKG